MLLWEAELHEAGEDRVRNRFRGDWKDAIGRGITAGWSALTGFPGMALSALQRTTINSSNNKHMNNQFFSKI